MIEFTNLVLNALILIAYVIVHACTRRVTQLIIISLILHPYLMSPALSNNFVGLMPMEVFDQIRVEYECDDYELCHATSACVHQDIRNEDKCVQHYVDEPYGRRS
jgi:hypothetical protein